MSAQCGSVINSFPYNENFEADDGGWVPGGSGNDWAWGTPAKPVINGPASGSNSWIVGGLTGSSYTDAAASWLQSPCFDFSNLPFPFIEFSVFWETEQVFDGAALQYSTDGGMTWSTVGAANSNDCINKNWYNHGSITYLSPFGVSRQGWSGNSQSTAGSCRGGGGSLGWKTASQVLPGLGNRSSVIFRFIFGAGTICNNYDGFAVDDIYIGHAPKPIAGFNYACVNSRMVSFTNTTTLCPTAYQWNFDDPSSGTANTATTPNATHIFSGPGTYSVSLTVYSPGTEPSTFTKEIHILDASISTIAKVDCQTNTGGSLKVDLNGPPGIPLNISWNTNPVQNTQIITGLPEGNYTVNVTGVDICPVSASGKAEKDISCLGIYFPNAFTPNNDRRNDGFGPLGSTLSLTEYQLSIYNRWGERVFYSTDPLKKWDGSVRGFKTDGNVFVWYAEYRLNGSARENRKGVVMLIR